MTFINLKQIFQRIGLKPGDIAADLGCGHGFPALSAAKIVGESGLVYALDIQKAALSVVSDKSNLDGLKNIQLIWGDLEGSINDFQNLSDTSKLEVKSLDFVFLINTLFQSKDPVKFITIAKKLIKPDGKILVIDWQPSKQHPLGPKINYRLSKDNIKTIAASLGLKPIDEFAAGEFHWAILLKY